VYFSTDYVFDGLAGPYGESDLARPLSVYGAAKRDAEIALAEVLGDALLVVRTCWVFGPESQGKNFAYQVRRALRDEKTLTCPSDQTSSPTYGPDIAEAVVRLVELGRSGLIHVAGPEVVDRVGFARSLAAAFHLDSAWIEGKSTAELGQVAPRPLKGGLLTRRLDELLPGLMRPLSQTLPEFQAWLAVSDKWAPPSTYDEPGAERVAD
jgi:dTDP-4-dehydrorhamnose reductase